MSSGAPGDRTCQSGKCHAGGDLNSMLATIVIKGVPEKFIPGKVYDISIHLEQPGMKKWGFQTTVADKDGNAIGKLISTDGQNTQILDKSRYQSQTGRQYLTHTQAGSEGPKKGISPVWKMQWEAPTDSSRRPAFYFALNAANGNDKKTGDFIYTRTIQTQPDKK